MCTCARSWFRVLQELTCCDAYKLDVDELRFGVDFGRTLWTGATIWEGCPRKYCAVRLGADLVRTYAHVCRSCFFLLRKVLVLCMVSGHMGVLIRCGSWEDFVHMCSMSGCGFCEDLCTCVYELGVLAKKGSSSDA